MSGGVRRWAREAVASSSSPGQRGRQRARHARHVARTELPVLISSSLSWTHLDRSAAARLSRSTIRPKNSLNGGAVRRAWRGRRRWQRERRQGAPTAVGGDVQGLRSLTRAGRPGVVVPSRGRGTVHVVRRTCGPCGACERRFTCHRPLGPTTSTDTTCRSDRGTAGATGIGRSAGRTATAAGEARRSIGASGVPASPRQGQEPRPPEPAPLAHHGHRCAGRRLLRRSDRRGHP